MSSSCRGVATGLVCAASLVAIAFWVLKAPTVQGRKVANDDTRRYLHRGLAERNFERRFQLADYVVVTDASLADGLLSISLKRELPEALKPRRIEISAAQPQVTAAKDTLIEGEKAA